MNEVVVKKGSILKALLTLALPIMLANIFQAAYQLTDSFWVGRLGEKAVAAVAMSSPIIYLMISMGIGFAVAGSTLVAQYFGAKNEKMVNHAAAQTILMVLVVSLIFSVLGYVFAPNILHYMGASPDIFNNALAFLRMSFLGLVVNFAFFMFQSVMRSIGQAKFPVFIVMGTVVLNFLLDPLFMLGWGPIPRLGIMGVALATFMTQTLAAVVGMVVLFSGKKGIHLCLDDFVPDYQFIRKAVKLGLPSSIEQSARSFSMTVLTSLIAGFGTLSVAAYGVGANIVQLVLILSMGLSVSTSALVGQNIGAKDVERAEKIGRMGILVAFWGLSMAGIIAYIAAPLFLSLFVPNDPVVVMAGTQFIRTISLAFGLMGVQMAVSGVLQASGNTFTAMLLTVVSQWIVQIPLAYLLSHILGWGIDGVWVAFPITNVIMSIAALSVFFAGKWKEKRLTEEDQMSEKIMEEVQSDEIVP